MRLAFLWLCTGCILPAQVVVSGKAVDDNGLAVAGARIEVRSAQQSQPAVALSDPAGGFSFDLERPGDYQVRAEREGFFVFTAGSVTFLEGRNQLTIVLNHLQEFTESVEVTYSPPAIDPQQSSDRKQLNSMEILDVPYPAAHDLRKALPLFQGVVEDNAGRLHFNGGASDQTSFTLDGFNIADPVTGRFDSRVNIDSVRELELESSRFSVDKGRGSAGSLDIKTAMGDDRFRFSGTNFVPGVSTEKGLHINKWTPRFQVSGPIARGRAWFHNGFDTYYDKDLVYGLPAGEDATRSVTTSNLTRFQVNLTPANILTASVLLNYIDRYRNGLSFLEPVEATTNRRQNLYLGSIKDQIYFRGGALVELGFAETRSMTRDSPQGRQTYEILPWGKRGNYFADMTRHTTRRQWLASAVLPQFQAYGSHQLRVGVDAQQSAFSQLNQRHDYLVLRHDLSVARHVTFAGAGRLGKSNFELAQYAQDRWTPARDLLIETGLRADWDQLVRSVLLSPRVAVAWAPHQLADTKFSAGFGVFHDALTLGTLTQHQDQISLSTFYYPNGTVQRGPVETAFLVDERTIRAPRYQTFSLSVERRLPWDFYGKASYVRRSGRHGFTFINQLETFGGAAPEGGLYRLSNSRNDRYDAVELTVRRTFRGQFEWLAGYTRSSARSDAVIDYSLENPIFAPQGPGPVAWDTPSRLLTWGWAPFPGRVLPRLLAPLGRELNISYLVEYRTGFPFSLVNEEGILVGAPNSRRLPSYFSVNLHFEKKFRFLHYLWAWRFGLNNLTNNGNPNAVDNNVDSPTFLSYGRGQHRAFTVRLRFLGRK